MSMWHPVGLLMLKSEHIHVEIGVSYPTSIWALWLCYLESHCFSSQAAPLTWTSSAQTVLKALLTFALAMRWQNISGWNLPGSKASSPERAVLSVVVLRSTYFWLYHLSVYSLKHDCICQGFVSSCYAIEYVQVLPLMKHFCSHYAWNNVNTQELD